MSRYPLSAGDILCSVARDARTEIFAPNKYDERFNREDAFDETIITSFLAASGYVTLPVAIFSNVRYGVDPVITAIATMLTAGTALMLALNALLRRSR